MDCRNGRDVEIRSRQAHALRYPGKSESDVRDGTVESLVDVADALAAAGR